MVRTLPYVSNLRLDGGRIIAYATVISVHVLAAMLLLIPLTVPPLNIKPDDIVIIDRIPMPPPVTQETVPVKQPPVKQEHKAVPVKQTVSTPTDTPPAVDVGTVPAEAVATETSTTDSIAESIGPVTVNQLAYLTATPPPYPRAELIAGVQGTVLLRILVDVDGKPLDVTVERSSGNRNLDRSAQQHVLKTWRFQPAMQNGHAVQAYGLVPVVFSMQ
jgi:protein TonB